MHWEIADDNASAMVAGAWRLTVDHGAEVGAASAWSLSRGGVWRCDYATEEEAKAAAEAAQEAHRPHDVLAHPHCESGARACGACKGLSVCKDCDQCLNCDGVRRTECPQRTYLVRGTVYPSGASRRRYPIEDFPCARCEYEHMPHLVDNSSEFYWEHQWKGSGRMECPRFNRRLSGGDVPKEGTAHPVYYCGRNRDKFPLNRPDGDCS